MLTLELLRHPPQAPGERAQERERRHVLGASEAVQKAAKDAELGATVDVGIVAVQVAEAALQAIRPRLEDEDAVRAS